MRADIPALGIALLCAGCTCGGEEAIAELVDKNGPVHRDFAASINEWESADEGATFAIGDGVRTSDDARATLTLLGGAHLEMDPSTEIRFARSDEEGGRLEVMTGAATLEAGDGARIDTELGLAVLEGGTRVRLTQGGLSVIIGAASIETEEGRRSLAEGESYTKAAPREAPEVATPPPEPTVPEEEGVDVVVAGRVERESGEAWSALPAGAHRVAAGTRLRLARDATATLEQDGDRVRAFGAGVIIVAPSEDELVEALGGRARIEATTNEVRIRVPGGVIIASAPSAGDMRIEETATEVHAEQGRIVLRDAAGEETTLEAGETGSIARTAEAEGTEEVQGPPELTLAAGGSATIHDPDAPIVVRFAVPECEGGTVELRPNHGALVHQLARGRHAYAVRCPGSGSPRSRGRVTVVTDSGEARLPRAPPASLVDADGRAYTVLYQNQLPVITVRWREAPQRGPYRLAFLNTRRPFMVSQQPTFAFASGDLADGAHRFAVEAGSARSEPTTITIRFDNAAPAATVQEPANGSFGSGERVTVRGMALPGWSVVIAGTAVTPDDSNRFQATVVAPDGPLVIRLSHPRHGVHYYLRRPRGG